MTCRAYSSEKNEKLQCKLIQDDSNVNTITIRVKRSTTDDLVIDDRADESRPKKFKMIANQPAIAVSAGAFQFLLFSSFSLYNFHIQQFYLNSSIKFDFD